MDTRTPEEIAAGIVERYRFEKRHSPFDRTSMCEMVAAAIRAERAARDAAIAAERERCINAMWGHRPDASFDDSQAGHTERQSRCFTILRPPSARSPTMPERTVDDGPPLRLFTLAPPIRNSPVWRKLQAAAISLGVVPDKAKPAPPVNEWAPRGKPVLTNWQRLLREVADCHGFTPKALIGPRRTTKLVAARQELMYRLRVELGMSHTVIGRRVKRDRTTVIYGICAHAERHGLKVPE